jgi:hypothetical protein
MWDRFKNWKKDTTFGAICPLCQHNNTLKAETCASCSYQLNKPNHQQISNLEEAETNVLFDELMSEYDDEKEEQIIDWSKATFKMDDVTVDVNQYTEDESVHLSSKPNFAMAGSSIELPKEESLEEEYELKPEDAPALSTKFEIPHEEPEALEEIEYTPVELIQPISGTPDNVQITPPEQITENIEEIEILDAADFDGDGSVDVYEEAFFKEDETNEETIGFQEPIIDNTIDAKDSDEVSQVPSAPLDLPPLQIIQEEANSPPKEVPANIPAAPIIPLLNANEILSPNDDEKIIFWPWEQQDEWHFSELKEQVLAAMRAAIDKNIAQATVLIDEVGPHLGTQINLIYPIGKLLDTLGRPRSVDKMIKLAFNSLPDDPNVIQAKQKLRP